MRKKREEDEAEKMLSPSLAGQLFQPAITTQTLRNYVKAGKLKQYTTGRHVYFKKGDVLGLVKANQRYRHG
jgi:hypothetical protein